ncbi:MAG: PRC-barrel domain-containing protein [Opitutaceae bacterium]
MKTHHAMKFLRLGRRAVWPVSFALIALAVGGPNASFAQQPTRVRSGWGIEPPTFRVRVATPDVIPFALSQLSGKRLRGKGQEELGSISDFLVDPQSGAVRFAVVPSGGDANNPSARLVPMSVFDSNNNSQDGFNLRIGKIQWDQVGTIPERELQGRIAVDREHRDRLARQFSLPPLSGEDATTGTWLVRAIQLRGQPVRTPQDQLGIVDDVVVDVLNRSAAVVIKATGMGAGADTKFIVPFSQLQFSPDGPVAIATNLRRGEFQQALAYLAPTGFPNAPSGGTGPSVQSAVTAVQQALARDQSAAGVQVVPESRLVLRGSVESEQKKAEIQRAALQAAPGLRIDNEITVRRW